jgi:hypothetical protein
MAANHDALLLIKMDLKYGIMGMMVEGPPTS